MPYSFLYPLVPRDTTTDYSQTLTPETDSIISTCYVLALIAVGLRIYCRLKSGTRLWWDDWTLLAAMFWITVSYLVVMISIRNYLGHHIWALGLDAYTPFLKGFFALEMLYLIDITLVKTSFLLFYWRIFAVSARKTIIVVAVIVGLWALGTMLIDIFQCWPVSYYWNRFAETGTCVNPQTFFLGISIPNIITDFFLTILPLPHVFRLKLRLGQRVLLAGIFMVGFFIFFVAIIRIVLIMQADLNDPDLTWNLTSTTLWSIVEIMVAVICACLPTFRPLGKTIGKTFAGPLNILSYISGKQTSAGGSSRRNGKMTTSSFDPSTQPSIKRDPFASYAQYCSLQNKRNPLQLTACERELTDAEDWGHLNPTVEAGMPSPETDAWGDRAGMTHPERIKVQKAWTVQYEEV